MTIFADASGLISLFSEKDSNHKKALKIAEETESGIFLISNYIFAEIVTMLSKKEGRKKSIKIGEYIKAHYQWINLDIETENLAWEIFKKQKSKNVSFIDCTCFALYKKGNYDKAFSFDQDFKTNKIPVLE